MFDKLIHLCPPRKYPSDTLL